MSCMAQQFAPQSSQWHLSGWQASVTPQHLALAVMAIAAVRRTILRKCIFFEYKVEIEMMFLDCVAMLECRSEVEIEML